MAEMQQPARVVQAAPAAPRTPVATTPPPAQGPAIAGGPNTAPTANIDLSGYSASQLRRMLDELRNQRSDLANRRQTIGGSYETATGDNRAGIGERLRVLDQGIVNYEAEIARVGREYAARSAGETRIVPPGMPPGNWVREDEFAGWMTANFFVTATIMFLFVRRIFRRKYGRVPAAQTQQNMIGSTERLDRIEQAVDTIAVEIERVSENQRFMTRLMTETQLGDTIKDVRKSTELAKSAAESG